MTDSALGIALFDRIGTKVSFIEYGTVYQFASDPLWRRIIVGKLDAWIHHYTGPPQANLLFPLGIDISATKKLYIADRRNGWVHFADFDPSAQNLVNGGVWASPHFPRPVDVAWDGQNAPLTTQYFYVVDDSLAKVSYWDRNGGSSAWKWSYGSVGTGQGQFRVPSAVCVGKTVGGTGGTVFTTDFYVMDRGNRRIVWLRRGAGAPTWLGEYAMPAWDPADCAVDHFGNLYVADESGHRIHKLTSGLYPLASYGQYGKGQTNLNTLAFPHSISVPCGLKVVNSVGVWYCEGRTITAELWSSTTGAVEHYLGLEVSILVQPQTYSGVLGGWFGYKVTDHAYHSVDVLDEAGFIIASIPPSGLAPSGTQYPYWDGNYGNGTPAPEGYYHFRVSVTSAYGCGGQAWCAKTFTTSNFLSACPEFGCYQLRMPNDSSIAGHDEPASLFLSQRVLAQAQPLTRMSAAPALRQAPGSLSSIVREVGVRGLRFGVTRHASAAAVSIRVHSMSGRAVRVLVNEKLQPGIYEIGWDGLDDGGRPVAPGVYMAVMTIGSFRAVQRLIIR